MLDDALRAWLLADASLAAVIADRIHPDKLPQGVIFPAVRFFQVSLTADYSHDGDANLDMTRYQFDCLAPNRPQANQVASLLRTALQGLKHIRLDDIRFESVFMANALSGYDDGLNQWLAMRDFEITYKAV
jgi:hypothetical protein